MIAGLKISEKEYRALEIDSFSTIKDFVKDRKKYYRKYVLGEKIREDEVDGMITGSLVDCLLFTPENFEDKFVLSKYSKPTGQMGKFVDELYERTIQCLVDGTVTRDFKDIAQDAYNDVKYDRNGQEVAFKRDTFEKVLAKFLDSDAEGYYQELRDSTDKDVVTSLDIDNAEKILTELRSNEVTCEVVNATDNENVAVYNQLQYTFVLNGLEVKMMADKVIVNHRLKVVRIYDLKVTWNVEDFQRNFFLKKYSYLQAALYKIGVAKWAEENYPGYSVDQFQFIVADSINYYNPLIYVVPETDMIMFNRGFYQGGIKYPGLFELIDDIKWHKENGMWKVSRQNNERKGIVGLNIKFDE
jgi:hypothetical protein